MCTLAIFRNVCARYPIVVAANRDEFYERPAAAPQALADRPGIVAGRDLDAGGTWLGTRVEGPFLLAGVLNRRPPNGAGNAPHGLRSRGLLCLDALAAPSVDAFCRSFDRETAVAHGPFNLLLADFARAVVFDNREDAGSTELASGLSVLTNLNVNDPRCPRLASATKLFSGVADFLSTDPSAADLTGALASLLADHANAVHPQNDGPFSRLCVHAGPYGTRSSSIILASADGRVDYLHADGPPCATAFDIVRY